MKSMSEAEYEAHNNNYEGLCRACGAVRGCCEPDARNYPCEVCGENEVYGVEELLMMGELEIS